MEREAVLFGRRIRELRMKQAAAAVGQCRMMHIYDKFFSEGDAHRTALTEFNSNNTRILNVAETKARIAALAYIQDELAAWEK